MVDCALHAMQEILADHPKPCSMDRTSADGWAASSERPPRWLRNSATNASLIPPFKKRSSLVRPLACQLRDCVLSWKCSLRITSGPASTNSSPSSAEATSCPMANGPFTASSVFPSAPTVPAAPTQFEHRICARQHPGHQGGVSVQRRRLERIAQVRLLRSESRRCARTQRAVLVQNPRDRSRKSH